MSNELNPIIGFSHTLTLQWLSPGAMVRRAGEKKWRVCRTSAIINHFYFHVYLSWFVSITLSEFQLHEPCYCFPRVKKTFVCLNPFAEEE